MQKKNEINFQRVNQRFKSTYHISLIVFTINDLFPAKL